MDTFKENLTLKTDVAHSSCMRFLLDAVEQPEPEPERTRPRFTAEDYDCEGETVVVGLTGYTPFRTILVTLLLLLMIDHYLQCCGGLRFAVLAQSSSCLQNRGLETIQAAIEIFSIQPIP